jgi:hypothetical protein
VLPPQIGEALLRSEGPHAGYLAQAIALERPGPATASTVDATAPEAGRETSNAALLRALASTDALLAMV